MTRRLVSLLLCALTLLEAHSALAELPPPGAPDASVKLAAPPPLESPPPAARGTLALAGTGIFAAWYGAAILESYAWSGAPAHDRLRIPVVGPWMTMAHAGCASGEANCTDAIAVIRAILAGVSAVGQIGGLAAIAEAGFMRTAVATPAPAAGIHSVSFAAGQGSIGLGLSGSF